MISGASSEELDIANARADIILALDNTATYESWLYIDTYIESLENEKQQLISFLEIKIKESKKKAKEYEQEREFDWQIYEEHTVEICQEVLDFVRGGKDE